MCADIYTKAFNDADKWGVAQRLVNICDQNDLNLLIDEQTVRSKNPEYLGVPKTPTGQSGHNCTTY